MKKWFSILAVVLALTQISLILWFESFDWRLGTIITVFYSLFLLFVHCLSILLSKKGILQKSIIGLTLVQAVMILTLLMDLIEIHALWYWQFAIGVICISLGMISSSLYRKVNPLVYYLQYMIFAIIVFCLLALGMTKISTGTVTIGFSLLSLISAGIHLFNKEKSIQ